MRENKSCDLGVSGGHGRLSDSAHGEIGFGEVVVHIVNSDL